MTAAASEFHHHILYVLIFISLTALGIFIIQIWKVLDDCKKRAARRARQKEIRDGR